MASSPEDPREKILRRLDEVEQRLETLEERVAHPRPEVGPSATSTAPQVPPPPTTTKPRDELAPLLGRTLLILGGAFLVRALTEGGALPQRTGAALGLLYAGAWILAAHRAAGGKRRTSANFHGLAATLIAFPLLWETTVKFQFLSPTLSHVALVVLTASALAVAAHRRLAYLAWMVTIGAAATAIALSVGTHQLLPSVSFLLLLALATLWLGYFRAWRSLAWVAALLVDAMIGLMTTMVLVGDTERVHDLFSPAALVALQLALLVLYIGSFTVYALARKKEIRIFEVLQGGLVLLVGLGGGMLVVRSAGLGLVGLGVVALLLAGMSYLTAVLVDRGFPERRSFLFYTFLGLIFTLTALPSIVRGTLLVLALSVAALFMAWLGGRWQRATLSLHGAVYALGCAVTSGLLALCWQAFVGGAPAATPIPLSAWVALGCAMGLCAFPVAAHGRTWGRFSPVPRVGILALAVAGVGGFLITLTHGLLPAAETGPDVAVLAAYRTGILAIAAVGLSWMGGWKRMREAELLVYPVLAAGGLKLLLEDIPSGRPVTLVASLVFFGGALILAPTLTRRRAAQPPASC